MGEYIYLIRKAEFKLVDANVYKIGKTKRDIKIRLNEYYGDKDVYLTKEVNDCTKCEKELIYLLAENFEKVPLGREYFRGNIEDIKKVVENYFKNGEIPSLKNIEIQIKPKKVENYECERCCVSFKQKKHLIQHLTKRDECLGIFSDKPRDAIICSLKEKKGILCDKCNKPYSSKYYLIKHQCSNIDKKDKQPYSDLIKKIEILEEKFKLIEHQSIR